ncbi:MAG: DUF6350 family protein [Dermatophilaceae bacterium]
MTILDSAQPTTDEHARPAPAWRQPLLGGAAGAGVGLLAVLTIVGVVGSLAPRATVDWGAIFGTGATLWLLLGGARVAADGLLFALTPLLGLAALVWLARSSARRSLPATPTRWTYAAWLGGYIAVTLAAVALALAGPATPVWWSLPLPVLGVPALALALAELPTGRWEPIVRRVPRLIRRAVRPAIRTGALMLGLGCALVLLTVAVRIGRVSALYGELDTGVLGGFALTLGQALALPNLGLWAVSLLAGPGFTITEGSSVTLGHSDGGLLPLIPVLGALPGKASFGWYVWALYLVPVLAGGYAARRTLAEIPRLASGRTKVGSVAVTVGLTAVLLAVLDGVAGGSLGDGRLADVGPSALSLCLALMLALGLGAAVVVARDWWRLRR